MTEPVSLAPAILLHTPQLGENIGSAARVMLNFGLRDLRLIAPRDGWPNPAAETLSAGAFEAGVTISMHDNVQSAAEGLTFLLATTARPRGLEKQVFSAGEGVAELARRGNGGKGRAGVLFGGESSGLGNETVALCNAIMTYPVAPGFTSLNLAMAVGVFAHAWGAHMDGADGTPIAERYTDMDVPASRADLIRMFEHFEDELERAGYFYPPEKTPVMRQNLRAAFTRGDWTLQEVRTFRGAIKALALGRGKARIARED